jgi:AcrR family transcriptional regulator
VTGTRSYVSPRREARAAANRQAILEAFGEQLSEPGRDTLSPTEAAQRAGVSLRTVHNYFPNYESQITALATWFDSKFTPIAVAQGPDDLARYFRDIHAAALTNPLTRALATARPGVWKEVRQQRRTTRLDAIRRAVQQIDAPPRPTEDTTAMLLSLSGADAAWPMHDLYHLPLERIPDVIANTVQLLVNQLRTQAQQPQADTNPTGQ